MKLMPVATSAPLTVKCRLMLAARTVTLFCAAVASRFTAAPARPAMTEHVNSHALARRLSKGLDKDVLSLTLLLAGDAEGLGEVEAGPCRTAAEHDGVVAAATRQPRADERREIITGWWHGMTNQRITTDPVQQA